MFVNCAHKKALKYVLMFLISYLAVHYIIKQTPDEDSIKIACITTIAFAVLNMYYPCVQLELNKEK